MIQTLNASDVRSHWSQLINNVFRGETEIVVEKSGIPVAAIVSTKDYEKLQLIKQRQKKDFLFLKELRDAFEDEPEAQQAIGITQSISMARKTTHEHAL
jgi:prevent-host-death family protein